MSEERKETKSIEERRANQEQINKLVKEIHTALLGDVCKPKEPGLIPRLAKTEEAVEQHISNHWRWLTLIVGSFGLITWVISLFIG